MSNKFVPTKTSFNAREKIWSGLIRKKEFAQDCSIGKLALEALLKDPLHISQICHNNGNQYTNQEIATLSIRCAQHFKELGFKQCDIFGICATNSDYVAPVFLGGMLSGLIASTLDTSFEKNSIKHIISITKPKIMFCDGSIYNAIREAFTECNIDTQIYTLKDHIDGVREITEFLAEKEKDEKSFIVEPLLHGIRQTAAILCSSGSTGLPKGVCMSHESFLRTPVFVLDRDDKFLSFSTVFWLSGLSIIIEGTIQGATRVIIDKPFDPKDFFDIIEKHRVTAMNGPSSHLAMVLASEEIKKRDLSSLKTYLCGGSAVPFAFVNKMLSFYPNLTLYAGYGMSEASSIISMGKPTSNGCLGQLTPNFQIKVMNDNAEKLGPGEEGEFYIKVPFKWPGYFGDRKATKDVYSEDGWLRSGDLGYIDNAGDLYISGRKKEIMKYNNYQFSPTQIEDVITQMDEVAEVCAFGIPDIVSSHLPAAAVVKLTGSKLTEGDICSFVSQKLPHFSHLHGGVYFMDSIPKTASGKYHRSKVQAVCEQLLSKSKQMR